MDEEEEAQFRKEHGDCVCGSFLGTEKGWLCNRTLAMSVERGQVIRYHIRKGGDPGAVRTYLLGFGIAMLSIQQGKLPIHCSALATPEGGAILIAGESGAGKSTLTAELLKRGYRFLADDMAVVDISGKEGVWVYPAFPYMKLCRDVVLRQGYPPEELLYIDEKKDKFLVPCTGVFQREKARLERFVFLGIRWKKEAEDKSGKIKAEKITGPDSMIVYKDNLFLRHLWKKQDPGMEIWLTMVLTIFASASMGLIVSSLVRNADRAMAFAPFVLIVQLLFSGVLFALGDGALVISKITVSRWSMECLGNTADLNALPYKEIETETGKLMKIPAKPYEDFFVRTSEHLWHTWLILLLIMLICGVASTIVLRNLKKDKR